MLENRGEITDLSDSSSFSESSLESGYSTLEEELHLAEIREARKQKEREIKQQYDLLHKLNQRQLADSFSDESSSFSSSASSSSSSGESSLEDHDYEVYLPEEH